MSPIRIAPRPWGPEGGRTVLPAQVLADLLKADPAAPRVTYYDDTPGATQGERIELSAKVLANWVAKAGNLLQDELDLQPGANVVLDLPAEHWRTLYWSLAVWTVGGALVALPQGTTAAEDDEDAVQALEEADVLVTNRPRTDVHPEQVVVTLAALSRGHDGALPAGAIDEARELATYGDQLTPHTDPDRTDVALRTATGETAYADLVATGGRSGRRVHVTGDLSSVLRQTLAAWADGGSVVLVRSADQERLPQRLADEGADPASV